MVAKLRQSAGTQVPMRVLVVDDDPAVRDSAVAVLSLECFVEAVPGAGAASARIGDADADFDVIVVDYQMPGVNGMQLLTRVQRTHPDIVGILVTGHAELPEVRQARQDQNVFLVLIKPFDPHELLRWVRMAGRTARLRRANKTLTRQLAKAQ